MKIGRIILVIIGVLLALILVPAAFVGVRHVLAAQQVESDWKNTEVQPFNEVGTTRTLSILPLIDRNASGSLKGETGVSYLVQTDTMTILFDLGFNADDSAPLLSNMQQLHISLDDIDALVISHYHPDHVGGLTPYTRGTFSFGEAVDLGTKPVYVPVAVSYEGASPVVSSEPTVLAPGVATTGTLGFPELFPGMVLRDPNYEQSLLVNVEGKGVVVIAGCGHPSLSKIFQRAEALMPEPLYGFVGGLHHPDLDGTDLQPEMAVIQQHGLSLLAPSPHDSSPAALTTLREAFPHAFQDLIVGQPIVIGA